MATSGLGILSTCKFPGCKKPCYTEGDYQYDFCGRTHAAEYKKKFAVQKCFTDPLHRATKVTSKQPGISRFLPAATRPSFSTSNAGEIKFYDKDSPYYEFTNFYPACIHLDGKTWPTTEHYFQAQKFFGTPYVEMIRNLPTPREAFQMARDPTVSRWRRKDWKDVKDDYMLEALRCKFIQHRDLGKKLVETHDKQLVEHTANDAYWGDGGDGSGQNKLGKLLMQVRSELQANGQYKSSSRRRANSFSAAKPFPGISTTAKHPTHVGSGVVPTHMQANPLAAQCKRTNQSSVPYNIISNYPFQ